MIRTHLTPDRRPLVEFDEGGGHLFHIYGSVPVTQLRWRAKITYAYEHDDDVSVVQVLFEEFVPDNVDDPTGIWRQLGSTIVNGRVT